MAVLTWTLAATRGYALDDEDRLRGWIIERLMCDFEVDLAGVAPKADFAEEISMLAPLEKAGLVVIRDGKLTVMETGRSVVRVVASTFDTYRRYAGTQFSAAV
jgi:oxygen-independent coproporphyrinogen-3 oxidase